MSHITKTLEFPSELKPLYAKAVRYEWLSLFYMISAATFSFLVMSNSQTMKTVWLEDTLGIIPPLSFLISSKMIKWNANRNFPYGFHRITSMAYFTSSLALFILGAFLLVDGTFVLLKQDHPTIPTIFFSNYSIWLGFLMIAALCWSSLPSTIFGHIKIPLAHKLNDKILFADSKMNKASWMSGFASIVGILGIGMGFWWADASIGIFISLTILKDGYSNLKQSILDLLDEIPKSLGSNSTDPLMAKVKSLIMKEDWVKSVELRFRDEGHVFFGDVFITPKNKDFSWEKIALLKNTIEQFDWRLQDIVIMPVLPKKQKNSSRR